MSEIEPSPQIPWKPIVWFGVFLVLAYFPVILGLVKHWNFAGTHSGVFFGIPATGKKVSLDGVTLVRMSKGKIAE